MRIKSPQYIHLPPPRASHRDALYPLPACVYSNSTPLLYPPGPLYRGNFKPPELESATYVHSSAMMLHHVLFGRPAAIIFVLLLQLVVNSSTESVASQYDHLQEQDGAMQITHGGSSPSSTLARRPHGQEAVLSLSVRSSDSECQVVAGKLWWVGCLTYETLLENNCMGSGAHPVYYLYHEQLPSIHDLCFRRLWLFFQQQ